MAESSYAETYIALRDLQCPPLAVQVKSSPSAKDKIMFILEVKANLSSRCRPLNRYMLATYDDGFVGKGDTNANPMLSVFRVVTDCECRVRVDAGYTAWVREVQWMWAPKMPPGNSWLSLSTMNFEDPEGGELLDQSGYRPLGHLLYPPLAVHPKSRGCGKEKPLYLLRVETDLSSRCRPSKRYLLATFDAGFVCEEDPNPNPALSLFRIDADCQGQVRVDAGYTAWLREYQAIWSRKMPSGSSWMSLSTVNIESAGGVEGCAPVTEQERPGGGQLVVGRSGQYVRMYPFAVQNVEREGKPDHARNG